MTIIVRDDGFHAEDYDGAVTDIAPDTAPADLPQHYDDIGLIRVAFPSFADGRGFTLARLLRGGGYRGRLRAAGHVIADQYAMARRSGFDEVEIGEDLAARQPVEQWQARANWQDHHYRARLRA